LHPPLGPLDIYSKGTMLGGDLTAKAWAWGGPGSQKKKKKEQLFGSKPRGQGT